MTTKLAEILFDSYRLALPNANIKVTWPDLPDEMKEAWERVAETKQDAEVERLRDALEQIAGIETSDPEINRRLAINTLADLYGT